MTTRPFCCAGNVFAYCPLPLPGCDNGCAPWAWPGACACSRRSLARTPSLCSLGSSSPPNSELFAPTSRPLPGSYGTFYRSGECTLKSQQLAPDSLPTWYARVSPTVRVEGAACRVRLGRRSSAGRRRTVDANQANEARPACSMCHRCQPLLNAGPPGAVDGRLPGRWQRTERLTLFAQHCAICRPAARARHAIFACPPLP